MRCGRRFGADLKEGGRLWFREKVTLEEAAAWLGGGSRGESQPQHGVGTLGLGAQPGPQPGMEAGHRQPHACRGEGTQTGP